MSDKTERIEVQIADDKQSVAVNFLPASGVKGSLNLNLDQLTLLIQTLGNIRSQMVTGQEIPLSKAKPLRRSSIHDGIFIRRR